jgi:hypothetical protein
VASIWVVPGAPLEDGGGWRLWFSWPGKGDLEEPAVEVRHRGTLQQHKPGGWKRFDPLEGASRRMGVLTVELEQKKPGERYDVTVPEVGTFRWRSLPAQVGQEGVAFLLASCFWLPGDKEGSYRRAVLELTKLADPAFKLLIGDQVYQDYPLRRPGGDIPKLFAERYESYWSDGFYRDVLCSTPNFFTCDDHEFWNNYPERQPWLPQSWDAFRQQSSDSAQAAYHRFQRGANPGERRFYPFRIGRVSFFVSDARSERTAEVSAPGAHFFSEEQWAELEQWAAGLTGPGVLVIGQPLFDEEGGKTDRSLASFRTDFGRLLNIFEKTLAGLHDILILTGDIHTGRYAAATLVGSTPAANVHEFVASPTSRVGPFFMPASPKPAPTDIKASHDNRPIHWAVSEVAQSATIDDNLGVVRMRPWSGNRVLFELELWRVRPRDTRSFWDRALFRERPDGPVARLFHKEILLR